MAPRWSTLLPVALGVVAAGVVVAEFVVPGRADRLRAAGPLAKLDPALARTFSDEGEFTAKRKPASGDWLAQHREPGQTYPQYVRSGPNKPDGKRRVLYILPLGEFEEGKAPPLETLQRYTAAYYHPLRVEILEPVPEKAVMAKSRQRAGFKQWHSEGILRWMQGRLPDDAYAMVAITMTDLYPQESWNYVFGQASLRHRVGVFSFARYHPAFWGGEADAGTATLVLTRAAKVLTHEAGHMFGVAHCIHYECNMNGSNNLPEADAAPIHLCPVCLRKLHHAIGFDPVTRYEKLLEFYDAEGMKEEGKWVRERIEAIEKAGG